MLQVLQVIIMSGMITVVFHRQPLQLPQTQVLRRVHCKVVQLIIGMCMLLFREVILIILQFIVLLQQHRELHL